MIFHVSCLFRRWACKIHQTHLGFPICLIFIFLFRLYWMSQFRDCKNKKHIIYEGESYCNLRAWVENRSCRCCHEFLTNWAHRCGFIIDFMQLSFAEHCKISITIWISTNITSGDQIYKHYDDSQQLKH